MKAERKLFSTNHLHEATVILPKKIVSLQEQTQQKQDHLKQLSNDASHTAYEIACNKKTTDDRFLDMALVLASSLIQETGHHQYHSDKIIEATREIHSRLVEFDAKLKNNPNQPVLLDRTKIYESRGANLSLDLGLLSDSPFVNHAINEGHLSSTWFWHDLARSIRISLEGYRQIQHADNMWHPPLIRIWTNPDYQNQWFSEDITGFFAIDELPDHDYNGLKKELFGESIQYVGGIFIGKNEILSHLDCTRKTLNADRYEGSRVKNLLALQPIFQSATLL